MRQFPWIIILAALAMAPPAPADDALTEQVRVAGDGAGFVLHPSGRQFVPLGFNYDHDEDGRLIEDYWHDEWPKVEADFREMADLGANVVRVHLQFGRFMDGPDTPNAANLDRLRRLLELAAATGLRLDLTGLACYHKDDVPPWYDDLDEPARWAAQIAFWKAVAAVGNAHRPALFCYDLMNEPVVPGGRREPGDWLGPGFAGKHFVQFITLDQADRPRPEIARAWVETLAKAIRAVDDQTLITVGLVHWSLDRPGLTSGFVPGAIAGPLDFLAVHIYPERGKVDEALETLEGFNIGKPVVIEETFPLKCGADELKRFLTDAFDRKLAAGVIGFYWGKPLPDLKAGGTIADALTAAWLELFQELGASLRGPSE